MSIIWYFPSWHTCIWKWETRDHQRKQFTDRRSSLFFFCTLMLFRILHIIILNIVFSFDRWKNDVRYKKNRIKSLVEEVLCNSRSTMLRIIMYRILNNIQVQKKNKLDLLSVNCFLWWSLVSHFQIQVYHEGKYQVIDMEINPHWSLKLWYNTEQYYPPHYFLYCIVLLQLMI